MDGSQGWTPIFKYAGFYILWVLEAVNEKQETARPNGKSRLLFFASRYFWSDFGYGLTFLEIPAKREMTARIGRDF